MAICGQLTKSGIRAAFLRKAKPSLRSQFNAAEKDPLTVILGPDELAEGKVRLKMSAGKGTTTFSTEGNGEKDRGQLVAKEDLVREVKRVLQAISQPWTMATRVSGMQAEQQEIVQWKPLHQHEVWRSSFCSRNDPEGSVQCKRTRP
jgi:histidyl-tRNA synthetase